MFDMKNLGLTISSVAVISLLVATVNYSNIKTLREVKTGEYKLYCAVNNSYLKDIYIDPDLIISLDTDGLWTFSNGYATNCKLVANHNKR